MTAVIEAQPHSAPCLEDIRLDAAAVDQIVRELDKAEVERLNALTASSCTSQAEGGFEGAHFLISSSGAGDSESFPSIHKFKSSSSYDYAADVRVVVCSGFPFQRISDWGIKPVPFTIKKQAPRSQEYCPATAM
jgi:hypothetical protein